MHWVIDPWTPNWAALHGSCRRQPLLPPTGVTVSARFPMRDPKRLLRGDFDGVALCAGQHAVQVEQDDEALGELGDTLQIFGIDARDDRARRLDGGGAYAQDFAHSVDDDADNVIADLDDNGTRGTGVVGQWQAETAAEIG